MFVRLRPLLLVLAAATSAVSNVRHPAPDFSGRWVMDTVRSTRDGILTSLTMVVRRGGDTLYLQSEGANAQGAFTTNSVYDIAGRPTTNHMGPVDLTATAAWRSDTLVLTSAGSTQGMTIHIEDAWSLDATGSELTRRESLSVAGQARSEVLVLRKSAGGALQPF